jgi:hypothetical protein
MPDYYDTDLRRSLVLESDDYVLSRGSYGCPVIHWAPGTGLYPCPSLNRSDTDLWPHIPKRTVEAILTIEHAEGRHFHFCLNCVASDSHPLMVDYVPVSQR